jgi:hypothetical protein
VGAVLESQVQQIKYFGSEVNVGEFDCPRVWSLRLSSGFALCCVVFLFEFSSF